MDDEEAVLIVRPEHLGQTLRIAHVCSVSSKLQSEVNNKRVKELLSWSKNLLRIKMI